MPDAARPRLTPGIAAVLAVLGLSIVLWFVACVVPAFPFAEPLWYPAAWWYAVPPLIWLACACLLHWWARALPTGIAFQGVFVALQLGVIVFLNRIENDRPFDDRWPHDLGLATLLGGIAIVGHLVIGGLIARSSRKAATS